MDLEKKTDSEIASWIRNHEEKVATSVPMYFALLEERARRAQTHHKLSFDLSLEHLKIAAINQTCTTYGALAEASGVDWSQARHQMNGVNGHLDRLLDICHARQLPLLTAICVNQGNLATCDLGDEALAGFVSGAQRLGLAISEPRNFHHKSREECWEWGRRQGTD